MCGVNTHKTALLCSFQRTAIRIINQAGCQKSFINSETAERIEPESGFWHRMGEPQIKPFVFLFVEQKLWNSFVIFKSTVRQQISKYIFILTFICIFTHRLFFALLSLFCGPSVTDMVTQQWINECIHLPTPGLSCYFMSCRLCWLCLRMYVCIYQYVYILVWCTGVLWAYSSIIIINIMMRWCWESHPDLLPCALCSFYTE